MKQYLHNLILIYIFNSNEVTKFMTFARGCWNVSIRNVNRKSEKGNIGKKAVSFQIWPQVVDTGKKNAVVCIVTIPPHTGCGAGFYYAWTSLVDDRYRAGTVY